MRLTKSSSEVSLATFDINLATRTAATSTQTWVLDTSFPRTWGSDYSWAFDEVNPMRWQIIVPIM